MCYDSEFIPGSVVRVKGEFYPVEYRAGNLHAGFSRTGGMDPGSGHDIPGRHLAGIIITDKTVHSVTICMRTYEPCPFLRFPRLPETVEKERDEVDRFVGVIVILVPQHVGRRVFKKAVQIRNDFFPASHQFYHAAYVMRHEPSLLVRIAFYASVPFRCPGIRGPVFPAAVSFFRAEPAFVRIEDVPVGLGLPPVFFSIGLFAESLGKHRKAPVEITVFQGL